MDLDGMEEFKTILEHGHFCCGHSILVEKESIGHSGDIEGDAGQHVGLLCVSYQAMIRYKSLITMVTLGGLQLSFHCRKWHRCVGDDRLSLIHI